MVIQIDGCSFRINGTATDWAIEYPNKGKKSGWKGRYFYSSLEYAVAKAYELALRESDANVDMEGAVEEMRTTSGRLIKAVRKALKEAEQ